MFVLMTLYHSAQESRSIRPLWRVITSTGDIFQFLASLPDLQVLYIGELVPRHLSRLISSTRHTALLELLLVHLLKDPLSMSRWPGETSPYTGMRMST